MPVVGGYGDVEEGYTEEEEDQQVEEEEREGEEEEEQEEEGSNGGGDSDEEPSNGSDSDVGGSEIEYELEDNPEIFARLQLTFENSVNFGHLLSVASDGSFLVLASGHNPYLVHTVTFLPLTTMTRGNVFQYDHSELRSVDCGGAILSLSISHDCTTLFVNCRPFVSESYKEFQGMEQSRRRSEPAPDISTKVQLQVWDVQTAKLLYQLDGHKGFTTKVRPALSMLDSSPWPLILFIQANSLHIHTPIFTLGLPLLTVREGEHGQHDGWARLVYRERQVSKGRTSPHLALPTHNMCPSLSPTVANPARTIACTYGV